MLVAYPLVMMFGLAYAGEHYVTDGIAGALAAWLVHRTATRIERRRTERPPADTLESQSARDDPQETQCPPPRPPETQPATTPSSA